MNATNIQEKMKNIDEYIKLCFIDAFRIEGREYNECDYDFKYIIIKEHSKNPTWRLKFIIFKCKYERIKRRVHFRLKNNLKKNFDIGYGDSTLLKLDFVDKVNFNFTEMAFKVKNKIFYMDIYDNEVWQERDKNGFDISRHTEIKYFLFAGEKAKVDGKLQVDINTINKVTAKDTPKITWKKYKELYENCLGFPIGKGYEVICSEGVEIL